MIRYQYSAASQCPEATFFKKYTTANQVRWTEDLTVSGKIDKPLARTGMVRALLQLTTADGLGGELAVEWPEGIAGSSAEIRGALGGAVVRARTPAP